MREVDPRLQLASVLLSMKGIKIRTHITIINMPMGPATVSKELIVQVRTFLDNVFDVNSKNHKTYHIVMSLD